MSEPEVVKCGDGVYRRVVYGLGPYIADYPEQVLISGIVQGWCPRYSSTTTRFAQVIDTGLSCRERSSRQPETHSQMTQEPIRQLGVISIPPLIPTPTK